MRPPQDWRSARLTLGIGAVTAASWLLATAIGREELIAIAGGFIPARVGGLTGDTLPIPVWLTPLTAALIHGGFVHLAFNLLMLLFCGRTVEPILGMRGLIILYLVGAYAAAAAQWAAGPGELVPMIGASGAISAVMGAFALLFGRNRVNVANPAVAMLLHALWLAAAWVVLQLLIGYTFTSAAARPAVAAHIGGFVAGLLLARPLLLLRWRGA